MFVVLECGKLEEFSIFQHFLENRGHHFVRYADDCSIYVKSKRAGERVMTSISAYIGKELKLKVNMDKSSVTRPWHSKLLGFTFYHKKGTKGITVHRKSIATYKEKILAITCRGKPYPMEDRMMQIRQLNQGWGNYFKLSDAKSVFEDLDSCGVRKLERHHNPAENS